VNVEPAILAGLEKERPAETEEGAEDAVVVAEEASLSPPLGTAALTHSSRCPMAVLVTSMWTQWPQPRHLRLERHLRQRQAARTSQFLVPPVAEVAPLLPLLLPERRALPLPYR